MPYTKVNSKWLKDLNRRHDPIQVLVENTGKTFSDIDCTNVFFGQSSKANEIKAKINKWDLIKLLHSKVSHSQHEKTTYRTGGNICKLQN